MSTDEADLIPYTASLPAARSVLALAPHADDEVFGCGGTLALLQRRGARVTVVVATDSDFGVLASAEVPIQLARRAESIAAAAVLGYGEPLFWGLADRGLAYGPALIERVQAAIVEADADLVLAPSPAEVHPDHRVLAMAAAEALRRCGGERRLLLYEVGVPLQPNLLVDITAVWPDKREAMRAFTSQLATRAYDRFVEALNRYRAYTLTAEVEAAEAFFSVSAAQLAATGARSLPALSGALRRAPAAAGDEPLVSVLVRSTDRPTLDEALDSVAAQTYGNVEIVVVDACGRHRQLPPEWKGMALRLISRGERLPRAAAANVALEAARGDWLLFLDDDDLLLPDHLQRLVACVRTQGGSCAAYAGVRVVGPAGEEVEVFDEPEASVRLWATNVLPIHAVLFPRTVVEQGARFDEELDPYEDWDFWLRLIGHARLAHVPGVSAIYRSHLGQSAADAGADPAGEVARARARLAVLSRWLPRMTASRFDALLEIERGRADLARQDASQAWAEASQLRNELTLLRHRGEHGQT
jgi:LmbE family N-acetylglucosaminyl deacetylase